MRQWGSLVVMGWLLLSLVGCAKSSAEPPPASTIAQAEERPVEQSAQPGTEQPPAEQPSGEVQERAVKPSLPTLKDPNIKLPTFLPGQFGFMSWNGNWITAVGGGGRTSDAFHTDATQILAWEKFRLMPAGDNSYGIVTPTGNFVTAVGGGNRIAEPVLQSDRTQLQDWERFRLYMDYNGGYHSFQTLSTKYLTAVGGGGKITNPFHTDAAKVDRWEKFRMYKCGDLGTGYQYYIAGPGGASPLRALDGGGRTTNAIDYSQVPTVFNEWTRFKLIRQGDGSYALQTSNGINYLTAVNGGGLVLGPKTPVILQTDRTQVQDWEKFRIVDFGNCTYTIQTLSGWYFGSAGVNVLTIDSTRRSDINYAIKFRLIMAGVDGRR